MNAVANACRNPTCKVATDASCADGHSPPQSCPWFGEGAPYRNSDAGTSSEDERGHDPDFLALNKGNPLDPSALDAFMRSRPIRLIAVIGDKDSGKTTLICSLYEALLKSDLEPWGCFASQTIVAFERKLHLSRVASGLEEPDTEHTSLAEGLHFFHLGLCEMSDPLHTRVHLMISDRNGEAFEGVRNTHAMALEVREVVKADRVLIVLDGKKIADPTKRAGAFSSTRQLIRSLIQGGALGPLSDLQFVLTKDDLIQALPGRAAVEKLIAEFIERQKKEFESKVHRLSFWRVIARDPNSLQRVGVKELLEDWLESRPTAVHRAPVSGPRRTQADRLLDRVGLEYLP